MGEKEIRLRPEANKENKSSSQAERMPSFAVPENQKSDWSKIPDYFRGLKVDLKTAGDNPKFITYLKEVHGDDLDVTKSEDAPKLREAYVRFQRAEKITQQYANMFDKRFGELFKKAESSLAKKKGNTEALAFDGKNNSRLKPELNSTANPDNSKDSRPEKVDYKLSIELYIREIAKNHPEQLRKLEKKFERISQGEQKIEAKQKIIDAFQAQGGKEGLDEKLDILQKSNSWKRIIFSKPVIRLLGYGQKEILAFEKVQNEYGLKDSAKIREAVAQLKKEIKNIDQAEKAKDKIKSKYKKLRNEVYFENELAKKVFEKSQDLLDRKLSSMQDLDSLKDFKEGKKFIEQLKTAFDRELVIKGKKQENFDSLPTSINAEEFSNLEEYLDKAIEEKLEQRLRKALEKSEVTQIDAEVKNYLKKTEFVGKTNREAVTLVYETFIKLKKNMKLDIEKKLQLGFALNKYKYLTV